MNESQEYMVSTKSLDNFINSLKKIKKKMHYENNSFSHQLVVI